MQAILHCDRNWGIGKRNDLMFSLPKDMKFFRTTTSGKVVVMGSNTLLSFPGGKPLKNRTNIVLWPGGDEKRAQDVEPDARSGKTRGVSAVAPFRGRVHWVLLPHAGGAHGVVRPKRGGSSGVGIDDFKAD